MLCPPDRQEESTGRGHVSDGHSLTDVLVLVVQGVPELKELSYRFICFSVYFFSADF